MCIRQIDDITSRFERHRRLSPNVNKMIFDMISCCMENCCQVPYQRNCQMASRRGMCQKSRVRAEVEGARRAEPERCCRGVCGSRGHKEGESVSAVCAASLTEPVLPGALKGPTCVLHSPAHPGIHLCNRSSIEILNIEIELAEREGNACTGFILVSVSYFSTTSQLPLRANLGLK